MVKITTESTSDLEYLFEQNDISVLPLYVDLDGATYLDGETITPQEIFAKYDEKKVLPKTAARSTENFIDFFVEAKKQSSTGEVVHVSISNELSVTFSNALRAAQEVGGVYVVNSLSLSTGVGLLVLKAKDLAKEGKSASEIADHLNSLVPHVQASFVVDTMEYLHKGGRCSGIAKFFAGILKIKPMLMLKDGKIVVGQKFMGSFEKSITKYVEAILQQFDTPDCTRIFITHSHAEPKIVELVRQQVQQLAPQFKEVLETKAGCTVTAHCGKGTLGILYINKP